ncbi:MAG: hypothetical protein ACI814_002104 [Mariniblastus sp.]|jgi:hypothetical protein
MESLKVLPIQELNAHKESTVGIQCRYLFGRFVIILPHSSLFSWTLGFAAEAATSKRTHYSWRAATCGITPATRNCRCQRRSDRSDRVAKSSQRGWADSSDGTEAVMASPSASCTKVPQWEVVNPSMSVELPVHNSQNNLAQTVSRVVEVIFDISAKFEVLIVDDGSTNATEEVAHELAATYPQLKVARNAHRQGAFAAGYLREAQSWASRKRTVISSSFTKPRTAIFRRRRLRNFGQRATTKTSSWHVAKLLLNRGVADFAK